MGSASRLDSVLAKERALALLAEGKPVSVVAKAVERSQMTVKRWAAELASATEEALHGAVVVGASETREIIERAGPEAAKLLDDVIAGRVEPPMDERGRHDVGLLGIRVRAAQFVVERFVPALSEKTVHGQVRVSGEEALEKLRPLLEAPEDDGES